MDNSAIINIDDITCNGKSDINLGRLYISAVTSVLSLHLVEIVAVVPGKLRTS